MSVAIYAYLSLLFLNVVLVILRWSVLSRTDRIIGIFLCVTLASEFFSSLNPESPIARTRAASVYGGIGLFLFSMYFNQSVAVLKRVGAGWITGILSIVFMLAINFLSEPNRTINSEFLLVEATVIIVFSLFSIRQILLQENQNPYKTALFWFTCAFLFFWSITFTGWGLYPQFKSKSDTFNQVFFKILLGISYLYYSGLALILMKYKKLIPSGE